ncbi:DUF1476 domain-containing protein [Polycladidibacter hongkongensis]|uniref:DUF1476 domain-containing protein n=1 Tax=Polycladidibacter hongkongensis TaxID=1647556 RepID=UPI00082FF5B9|nr:DUF1476 domain-containing protein [Pseudovibrio hongkongensis]
MSLFDQRKQAFEGGYALGEDMLFKVKARRNKLLGAWAAQLMNLGEGESAAYAQSLVGYDLKDDGDGLVKDKVWADLQDAGVEKSEHQVERTMQELFLEARKQLETSG